MGRVRSPRTHPYPDLHDEIMAAGWSWRVNGGGHHEYRAPDGWVGTRGMLVIPCTPSGSARARLNIRSKIRRALRGNT
jgi:hypothetical protein